jgi:hypothetical protein
MVEAMKPGSVIVDLAAERGGNCTLTKADEKIVTDNGVTIIGYTDFPSRMATQSSNLYATNIRHMLDDLTPEKDGTPVVDMEDDVIRGALVTHEGEITWPPPAPKVKAIAAAKPKKKEPEETAEQKAAREMAAMKKSLNRTGLLLGIGSLLILGPGHGGAAELHAALHRLRAGRVRRLPRHLGRGAFAAYAADGDHQRDLVDHHRRGPAADRVGQFPGDDPGRGSRC